MAHGSWAHKTIIRPIDSGEFDADFIVFVEAVPRWSAADYINELYDALRLNGTYRSMITRSSHCITVHYANDKKIDVAPCVTNRTQLSQLEVCNRNSDQFERTEPKQYTDWLIQQNAYSGTNSFRKVTRLIKYLRDVKTRFTCSSVLLTTLLGYRIGPEDQGSELFADTPTAFKTLFARLDDWLTVYPLKPFVPNPFLPMEDFACTWTQDQYDNFRSRIRTYREWTDDAFDEPSWSASIAKWRRLFGDDFAKSVSLNEGRSISETVVSGVRRTLSDAVNFTGDLVDAIKRFGPVILPTDFDIKSYMEVPKWEPSGIDLPTFIRAELYWGGQSGQRIRVVNSLEPLQSGFWLHFKCVSNTGTPYDPSLYTVMWRVTNTDEAAAAANCLRGSFEDPQRDNSRWEQLKYRGVHLVEAFVVRKRDQRIVGRSNAFRVMVE